MDFYPYEFEAPVSRHSMGVNSRGELFYTVIYIPPHVLAEMGAAFRPKIRIEGEIADLPFEGALMPSRGQVYVMAPKALLKHIELEAADPLPIRFRIADQDAVTMPPVLSEALDALPDKRAAWEALTPGKRRGLVYPIAQAKTLPTQEKRVRALLETL